MYKKNTGTPLHPEFLQNTTFNKKIPHNLHQVKYWYSRETMAYQGNITGGLYS